MNEMELLDKNAFNESVAFSTGQAYERRRIGEIIKARLSTLEFLEKTPVKKEIIRNLKGELSRLLDTIEKE